MVFLTSPRFLTMNQALSIHSIHVWFFFHPVLFLTDSWQWEGKLLGKTQINKSQLA